MSADLEALARAVAPLVLQELVRALGGAQTHYSTRKGQGPPGFSEAAWKAVAPSIPGSYRPTTASGRPGRWVIVPRAAFEAWVGAQTKPEPTPVRPLALAWSPVAALASAGLRKGRVG